MSTSNNTSPTTRTNRSLKSSYGSFSSSHFPPFQQFRTMKSSSSSAPPWHYRFLWLPISLVVAYGAYRTVEASQRVYHSLKVMDRNRGVQHDHPSVNQAQVQAAGILGGVLGGSLTYEACRRLLLSTLLSRRPDLKLPKVFVLSPAYKLQEKQHLPTLTPTVLWRMLGPSSTPASYKLFAEGYGVRVGSSLLAMMWGLIVGPMCSAYIEGKMCPYEPNAVISFGSDNRKRREKRFMEAEAMRRQGELGKYK